MFVNIKAAFLKYGRAKNNNVLKTSTYSWTQRKSFSEFKNFFDLAYPEKANKSLLNQIYKSFKRNKKTKRITSFLLMTIGELYFKN